MTGAEQRRLMILNQVAAGVLVNAEGASLLGLSVRQLQRIRAAYLGFNQHHLTEMLSENEGLTLSRPTVHRILKAAGVPAVRKRRPQRHRRRRDRYPRPGMLLQIDGSRHDWLEGRAPWLTLVGGIDDATGLVPWAGFREQEDAQGYFELLRAVVRRYGIPLALYSDRHGIFFKTRDQHLSLEEELTARREPTQFGRLLEELGIELILARTPQAKGRVERLWGTFQDRLGSELRLAGAASAAEADQVLARYLPRHNKRFTVPPNDPAPAWLPWPKGQRLDDIFCFKYRRVVANDHTVRLRSQVIDIPPTRQRLSFAKVEVELHERFDGTLRVYYHGSCLATKVLDQAKTAYRVDQHSQATDSHEPQLLRSDPIPVAPAAPWRPAANHPWRTRAVQPK